MSPAIQAVLAAHLTRALSPPSRERARRLRRALYASWTATELHAEAMRVLEARAAAVDARHYFLGLLVDDLAEHIEARGEQDERRSA